VVPPEVFTIKLWYNDEHALTLGVRRVIVKTSGGTTTTDYPITPTPGTPACVTHPLVGTTSMTGDQSGNDTAAGGGRPLWPALFLTDLTLNGASSRAGDWQQGGTGISPTRVCGTWKGAVRTVDYTKNPVQVTVTPDADPAKNDWNIDGGDTPPGGFGSLVNEGYGAECKWSVSQLGLIPGHTYRLYFMVHDGDQNKVGGDVGHGCTTIHVSEPVTGIPGPGPVPTHFELSQNYPNPFRSQTTFSFAIPERSDVQLKVYDLLGRVVGTIISGVVEPGTHAIQWQPVDPSGHMLAPGMYMYRMTAVSEKSGQFTRIRRAILIK